MSRDTLLILYHIYGSMTLDFVQCIYDFFKLFSLNLNTITAVSYTHLVTEHSEIMHILDSGKVLHLGLVDQGKPYIVPMNYGYVFEGEKDRKSVV